jgi:type I restriction enzyme S subunit
VPNSLKPIANGFKETDIGVLPVDWDVATLGQVAALTLGRTPARKESRYWEVGSIPWVAIKDLNNGIITQTAESISQSAFDEVMRRKMVPAGSLLLSFKLTIGKVGILGIDAVHNEAIVSVVPNETEAHRDYLRFLLQWIDYEAYMDTYVKGRTLNKRKLNLLPIPVPPVPEQRRIAHVLSTIQRAIEAQDKLIAAAKELKRSLMQRLFTYGPGPEPATTKETEIGEIPEHWEVARLGDITQTYSGSTPRRDNAAYWEAGQVPWLKSGELQDDLVEGVQEFITEKALRETAVKFVEAGTLLVAMYGATAGKVGYTRIRTTINQAICAVVPSNSKFDSRFLFYWFAHSRPTLLSKRFGGAQPNLNQQVIKDLMVPLPPRHEQKAIANALAAVDAQTRAEESLRAALQELFKSMLHQLMTGQLRVTDIEV